MYLRGNEHALLWWESVPAGQECSGVGTLRHQWKERAKDLVRPTVSVGENQSPGQVTGSVAVFLPDPPEWDRRWCSPESESG